MIRWRIWTQGDHNRGRIFYAPTKEAAVKRASKWGTVLRIEDARQEAEDRITALLGLKGTR